jgi:hypothetical protein
VLGQRKGWLGSEEGVNRADGHIYGTVLQGVAGSQTLDWKELWMKWSASEE